MCFKSPFMSHSYRMVRALTFLSPSIRSFMTILEKKKKNLLFFPLQYSCPYETMSCNNAEA